MKLFFFFKDARAKNIAMHREWMIRNYTYTFAAVPFRFLPGIFLALGVPPESNVAYPLGAWLSVMISILVAEKFLEHTRNSSRDASIKRGTTIEVVSPLDGFESSVK